MSKAVAIIFLILVSTFTYAGTGIGKITGVIPYVKSSGERIFFIKVDSTLDAPSCNETNRFALSDTKPHFDITVSAILAAYHSKSDVKVRGHGSCNYWSNSEDINYICFGDIPC